MFRNIIVPQTTPAMPARAPEPSHRHGMPSGPWPFLDIDDGVPDGLDSPESDGPLSASPCNHVKGNEGDVCWCKYPQSLFPNWTPRQQRKSKIAKVVEKSTGLCTVHYVDVNKDGRFVSTTPHEVQESNVDAYWRAVLQERSEDVRCRALFVDHLTGPVLQMLGTAYKIEPFYFSSSLGWIPSRFQSNSIHGVGDHMTITLTFVRTLQNSTTVPHSTTVPPGPNSGARSASVASHKLVHGPQNVMIDTHAPLPLRSSEVILAPDLLALHMVRSEKGNTIISYHPNDNHHTTTAESLHKRFALTGRSVYWSTIFKQTNDPTLVLLSLLWYPLYCWDEVFEALYSHICFLESQVLITNDMNLTHELHAIRAHLLHYQSLLDDFQKTITFVQETPFPGLDDPEKYPPHDKEISQRHMKTECGNLLREVQRLRDSKELQERRLKNVMNLGFSMVNIEDSKYNQKLTEATVRDSAAMKQIAYLTMFFLPATFVAGIFGMNIGEINPGTNGTLLHFFAVVIPLTVITVWLIVASQIHAMPRFNFGRKEDEDQAEAEAPETGRTMYDHTDSRGLNTLSWWTRLSWPIVLVSSLFEKKNRKNQRGRIGNRYSISGVLGR